MALRFPSIEISEVSKFIVKRVDWKYFQIAVIVSAMYLFNVSAEPFVAGREALIGNTMASLLTNFPLLTMIYLTTLAELLGLKGLIRILVPKLRRGWSLTKNETSAIHAS